MRARRGWVESSGFASAVAGDALSCLAGLGAVGFVAPLGVIDEYVCAVVGGTTAEAFDAVGLDEVQQYER